MPYFSKGRQRNRSRTDGAAVRQSIELALRERTRDRITPAVGAHCRGIQPGPGLLDVRKQAHRPPGRCEDPEHACAHWVPVRGSHDRERSNRAPFKMQRSNTDADVQRIHRPHAHLAKSTIEQLAVTKRAGAVQHLQHLVNFGSFDEAVAPDLEKTLI